MAEASRRSFPRRSFLKALNLAIGGLIAAVLAVPGLRFLLFPVRPARRKIVEGPRDFLPVADASSVTAKPVRVEIVAPAQRDAWARVENVRLGAAWLVRDAGGGIRAFTTVCPHLGCAVDYDPQSNDFRCPCHTSAFALSGDRVSGPAKRGMDPLETRVDDDGRVLVRLRRFKLDVPEREDA
jgi:menaquinol-cytochrome c reductase iron-sulfur subunit